jgi:hypothetical protein
MPAGRAGQVQQWRGRDRRKQCHDDENAEDAIVNEPSVEAGVERSAVLSLNTMTY